MRELLRVAPDPARWNGQPSPDFSRAGTNRELAKLAQQSDVTDAVSDLADAVAVGGDAGMIFSLIVGL